MFLTRNVLRKYYAPEPGAGGGGNAPAPSPAPSPAPPTVPEELKPVIQAMIDAEVNGLKKKNGDLIGEQKTLKKQLEAFEGIDPEAVRAILSKFSSDEEAGLIAAGKIDEVLKRRTERMNADWQKKLDAEKTRAEKLEQKAAKLADRATAEALIKAANKTGALPEAHEDIVLRAKGAGWTINEDGDVVAQKDGEIILGKDGKTPLSPIEWAEGLRETAPHLWPRAQGSNAPGSGGGARGAKIDPSLSPEQRMTQVREQQAASMRH